MIMVSLHGEGRETSLIEDKRKKQGAESTHSSEPQKANLTGEFVIVA